MTRSTEDARPVVHETAIVREKRARLLAAATRLVQRKGPDVSVAEIAAEAGTGISSVYRLCGSKEALLDAMAAERVHEWETIWSAALEGEDAGDALRHALWTVGELQEADPSIGNLLRDRALRRPELLAGVRAITDRVLQRAKAAGVVREDMEWNDFTQFFLLLSALPRDDGTLWRRMLTLFIDSLRPHGTTPLPTSGARPAARRPRR